MNNILHFLRQLAANNTREWVAEHQSLYRTALDERDAVARRFIDTIAQIDPQAAYYPVKQATYRLVRDTRFSQDKSPYKTHIGIFVCPPLGKKSLLSGYYLHLEPGGESFICGGNYGLPVRYLTAIRDDIRDNIDEYLDIVESPEFKAFFPTVGIECLKTAPKGYDKAWPYIDYLRPKDFGVMMPLPDSYFDRPDFVEALLPQLVQIKRLNDFVNFALTESGLPLMREER